MIYILHAFWLTLLLSSCIGDYFIDDTIDSVLRVNNAIDTLAVGTDYQFQATYFNNVGQEEPTDVIWSSNNSDIISITPNGLVTAHALGEVEISASTTGIDGEVDFMFRLVAGETTTEASAGVRKGVIMTTTFYDLEGDFELRQNDDGTLTLDIADNYQASSSLPGLYIYLTNNPRSTSGAFEIGEVSVFSGAHSYDISGVELNEYNYLLYFCKPFSVKVGDGKIEE